MKKLAFALVVAPALLVAACNNANQDQVNNAELNQPSPELNGLANEAANNAEADALGNQLDQLNNEANASDDNTVNPKDADEQNVAGM
ncbi:MAG TPA: hypothetical protein VF079_08830 [Sphingomicrobium sp.]